MAISVLFRNENLSFQSFASCLLPAAISTEGPRTTPQETHGLLLPRPSSLNGLSSGSLSWSLPITSTPVLCRWRVKACQPPHGPPSCHWSSINERAWCWCTHLWTQGRENCDIPKDKGWVPFMLTPSSPNP